LHGMQEVGGSIPPGSTKSSQKAAAPGGFFVASIRHQPFVSWKGHSSSFLVEPP
jgi:hypothetical protein